MVNASFRRNIYSQYQAPSFEEIVKPLAIKQEMFDTSLATLGDMKQNLSTSFDRDKDILSGIQNEINTNVSQATNALLENGDIRNAKRAIINGKQVIQNNLEDPNSEGYRILQNERALQSAQAQIAEMRKTGKYNENDLARSLMVSKLRYERNSEAKNFSYENPLMFQNVAEKMMDYASKIKPTTLEQATGWSRDDANQRWIRGNEKRSEIPLEVSEYILGNLAETDIELKEYVEYRARTQTELAMLTNSLPYSIESDAAMVKELTDAKESVLADKKLSAAVKKRKAEQYDEAIASVSQYLTEDVIQDPAKQKAVYAQRYNDYLIKSQISPAISAASKAVQGLNIKKGTDIMNMSSSQLKAFGLITEEPKFDFNTQSAYEKTKVNEEYIKDLYSDIKPEQKYQLLNEKNEPLTKEMFISSYVKKVKKILEKAKDSPKTSEIRSYERLLEMEESERITLLSNDYDKMLAMPDYFRSKIATNVGFKRQPLSKTQLSDLQVKKQELQLQEARKLIPGLTVAELPAFRKQMLEALENTGQTPITTVTDENLYNEFQIKKGVLQKENLAFLLNRQFAVSREGKDYKSFKGAEEASQAISNLVGFEVSQAERIVTGNYAGGVKITGVDAKGKTAEILVEPMNDRFRNNFNTRVQTSVNTLTQNMKFLEHPPTFNGSANENVKIPKANFYGKGFTDFTQHPDIMQYGQMGVVSLPQLGNQPQPVVAVPITGLDKNVDGAATYGVKGYRLYIRTQEDDLTPIAIDVDKNTFELAAFKQSL
jgi:hypothetical protein